jgi:polyferredoxin
MNRLFRLTWFPLAFQLLTLGALVLLIVGGLTADTGDMGLAGVLRNTNAANLIVWSYWWPIIILSAIFLGRVWCTVCPIELVTSLASKVGLKRKPPAFLRSGWVITGFYILILFVGIHTLAIHRVPFRMALYMMGLFGAAVAVGLLFARNTFCAHVCPIGHLLGLYARLAPMGWGVRDKSLCSHCVDRSCSSDKTAYKFQGRSCGVFLRPADIEDNTECLVCGQCLKACDRNNPGIDARPNPGWFPRRWFRDLLDLKPMTAAQAAFCLVVSGFVVYEVFTEWPVTKDLLLWTPTKLGQALGANGTWSRGLVQSVTLFAALPAVFWLLPFVAFRLAGGRIPLGDYLLRFGIAFILGICGGRSGGCQNRARYPGCNLAVDRAACLARPGDNGRGDSADGRGDRPEPLRRTQTDRGSYAQIRLARRAALSDPRPLRRRLRRHDHRLASVLNEFVLLLHVEMAIMYIWKKLPCQSCETT